MIKLLENTRKPDITFNRNGRILITARIVRMLSIAPGDTINIAVHNDEYLLYANHNTFGRHEACCYPTKHGSHNFCANSVKLARAILATCGITEDRAAFMIGEQITIQDTVYCPIITRNPL